MDVASTYLQMFKERFGQKWTDALLFLITAGIFVGVLDLVLNDLRRIFSGLVRLLKTGTSGQLIIGLLGALLLWCIFLRVDKVWQTQKARFQFLQGKAEKTEWLEKQVEWLEKTNKVLELEALAEKRSAANSNKAQNTTNITRLDTRAPRTRRAKRS
jgi:hypothetical protein